MEKKRQLNVSITCKCYYNSTLMVPANLTEEEAIEYAKKHLNEVNITELEYINDTDVLDDKNCELAGITEEEILPMGTKVKDNNGNYIGVIDGDDREDCEIAADGLSYKILNYYVIPEGGKNSNDYVMYYYREVKPI